MYFISRKRILFAGIASTIALAAPSFAASQAPSQSCENLTGKWESDTNALIDIQSVDPLTGQVSGNYVATARTTSEVYKLSGITSSAPPEKGKDSNLKTLAFMVRLGKNGMISTWSGVCTPTRGKPVLRMIWNMVNPNGLKNWEHILTGYNTFRPSE